MDIPSLEEKLTFDFTSLIIPNKKAATDCSVTTSYSAQRHPTLAGVTPNYHRRGCETRWTADFFVSRSRSVLAYAIRSEPLFLASSNSLPLCFLVHLLR